ncbi:hypothetical protein BTUL_0055g00470 [Botrytis tulipae]|uniref:Uncharacterized protein n=1 Tax=Botrytis tulipae TaxID=87230 RepID=A0A4Z1EZL4_9HELO|nr:hypothetical protein BTUL_0055g00470 [Botrytis tulipae]
MSFLRWLRTYISPAEPCATVSQYSSTTSTHSPTPDANTNEISPDQCSAKLDSPRSLDNRDVADSEQHMSENITDQLATKPKRIQSPNVQLMNRDCNVPDAQKHFYIQESKKVVMTAMLSGVRRDIIVANLQGFEEEMKYYRAINMTKKDVEEQSREFSEFAKMTFYSRKTMKLVEKRLRGTSERKFAIRNYFYSQPDYLKKSEFNRNFARCFILGRTEREVCQALNAEMIARRIKYDSRQRTSRDPELLARDIMLAVKVLNSSRTIETPRCTLSFMRCFGVSMMPCGLLGRCNGGEIRTESSFFTDEPSNQSTLSVTMDEPAIDTSHTLSVIEPFTRAKSTTIDSDSDGEILTIAKPISQKRQSVIKETPVGKKAEKGYELRRKRILARNEIENENANENESGSESKNEGIIVVEDRRVIKTKDGSGDEDEDESVIKVKTERVIKIEDDSEREKEIYNKIEGEYDDSESSVDEDLYKAKLELLSQVSNELGLLNSKKRKMQKKKEEKDKSGSKRVKIE